MSRQEQASRPWLRVLLSSALSAVFVSFLLIFWAAGMIYDYQDTVDGASLPEVDAVVVLAGGRGRISTAGDVWYRYWEGAQVPLSGLGPRLPPRVKVPVFYFSGVAKQATWPSVSRQLRRGVLSSITERDVILENQSENTIENIEWLIGTARAEGWKSLLLVTSSYHMRRARSLFEKTWEANFAGKGELRPRLETLSVLTDPFEPGDWASSVAGIRVTMLEYLKWLYTETLWKAERKALPQVRREGGS